MTIKNGSGAGTMGVVLGANNDGNFGNTNNGITVSGNATLSSNSGTTVALHANRSITLNANLNLNGFVSNNRSWSIAGAITRAGDISINGATTNVTLTGANGFSGALSPANLRFDQHAVLIIAGDLDTGNAADFARGVGTLAPGNSVGVLTINDNLGKSWELCYNGGTGNDLTLVAIPEPGAFALGLLGVVTLLRRRQ